MCILIEMVTLEYDHSQLIQVESLKMNDGL